MKMRRESLDIIKDILELCTKPTKKTWIVYRCNLNFNVVKKYLRWCFINGWLVQNEGLNDYSTTELGEEYLNTLRIVLQPMQNSGIVAQ